MTIYQIVNIVIKKTLKQIRRDNEEKRVIYRNLCGVPLISLLEYVPLNASSDVSDTAEKRRNREILWVFKDGEPNKRYSKIAKVVLSAFAYIISKLLDCDSSEYTLAFIPGSNQETTEKRWGKFSRELASALDCENGFKHLLPTKDSVPRHYIGRGKVRPLYVDEEFFDGKRVVLVDDLVNTGETMKDAIRQLRNAGAEVVCCLSVATT